MSVWHISPADVKILLGGFHEVVGFVDGSFVSISKVQQPFTSVRAMDGTMARTYHMDTRYTLSLTIAQSSPSNDLFTKLWMLDEATKSVFFPLFIKDGLGSSMFYASQCWISQPPPITYSNDVDTRNWIFDCNGGVINIGSNTDNLNITEDVVDIIGSASVGSLTGLL